MPLSEDTGVVETSNGLVSTLRGAAAGAHHSFRPAHAKGQLLTGTFTPTTNAAELSSAPHFNQRSTPITVRFSSSTGLPQIPDTDPNANPRGIAIRFHLPDVHGKRQHTDIIAHSTKYFPTRTGAEFLEFLQAATGPNAGEAVPEFLSRHPETVRFLEDPKPSPSSFATETYFGVNAFHFTKDQTTTPIRYRILPVAPEQHLHPSDLHSKPPTYLYDDLTTRLQTSPIHFKLLAQIAAAGDPTNNATALWPEERELVQLGTIAIDRALSEEESLAKQQQIIFDPIPRVRGVQPSDDPLLEIRASVYLIAGRQRRGAGEGGSGEHGAGSERESAKAAT